MNQLWLRRKMWTSQLLYRKYNDKIIITYGLRVGAVRENMRPKSCSQTEEEVSKFLLYGIARCKKENTVPRGQDTMSVTFLNIYIYSFKHTNLSLVSSLRQ